MTLDDVKKMAETGLALIEAVLPQAQAVGTVAKIVDQLIALTPAVVQAARDLIPTIKNVAATIRDNPDTPSDLMDKLDQIDAVLDADFDAAAAAATAEDGAIK